MSLDSLLADLYNKWSQACNPRVQSLGAQQSMYCNELKQEIASLKKNNEKNNVCYNQLNNCQQQMGSLQSQINQLQAQVNHLRAESNQYRQMYDNSQRMLHDAQKVNNNPIHVVGYQGNTTGHQGNVIGHQGDIVNNNSTSDENVKKLIDLLNKEKPPNDVLSIIGDLVSKWMQR